MTTRAAVVFLIALFAVPAQAELTMNVTFTDTLAMTWDATTEGVINQAISDWQDKIDGIDNGAGGVDSVTVNFSVEFDYLGLGGPLGVWNGQVSGFFGADVRPWVAGDSSYNVTHTLTFNADLVNNPGGNDLWFDPTPGDDGSDKAFSDWDALSVARHEIGHMLGFTSLYVDDFGVTNANPWTSLISSNVFDPTGLNVAMHPGDPGHVLADELLMDTALSNAEGRIDVSQTELEMLSLAYGYSLAVTAIPEPSFAAMLALATPVVACRRRRAKKTR